MSRPQLGRPVGASGTQTRERIIAATIRCVAQAGYAKATIREIAQQAGITSANLYNYFPNKSELIKATIAARADIAMPRLRAAADRPGTTADRIDALLDESGRLMGEYPDLARFEWAIRAQGGVNPYPDAAGGRTGYQAGFQTGFQALRDVIEGIVDDSCRHGALPAKPGRRATVDVLYGLVYGLTELAATSSPAAYQRALTAAKQLVRGTLFEVDR